MVDLCLARGNSLRVGVWDTGVGIQEEDRKAIFQEFHRLDYAERLEDKGLGLGLAICDRIAAGRSGPTSGAATATR